MTFLNRKNIVFGLVGMLLLGMALTVSVLQRQQETRSRASASTTLSFTPATSTSAPMQKNVGEIISLDLMVTPGNNLVTFVKFKLSYDPTKLVPVTPDPFTLNTAAFQSKDGPIINSGSLLASASVGSDPTKAIQKPTKIGTVQFRTLGPTGNTPTTISFATDTQALSSASSDEASENVISTTSPANIIIGGYLAACTSKKFIAEMTGGQMVPTNTSSASGTTTIELLQEAGRANAVTSTKNLQPGNITGIFINNDATATTSGTQRVTMFAPGQNGAFSSPQTSPNFFIPDDVITDMENGEAYVNLTTQQFPNGEIRGKITCDTGQEVKSTPLNFELLLHGVGSAGDNPNPNGSDLSNKDPLHPQRNIHVEIYDTNNQLVSSVSSPLSLNYDAASGTFMGKLDLGIAFREGSYNLKVKTDRYLRKRVPGILEIKARTENKVPKVDLVAGDTNGDNFLNIIDYNAFLDCGYGGLEPLPIVDPGSGFNTKECQAHTPPEHVDIDDNGVINSFDYNLFLRELSVQNGD